MAKLTEEERKFLSSLRSDGAPTGRWEIPLASRAQDRARLRAKQRQWAYFDRKNWAWRITPAGRAALTEGKG